jgi:hypothetical protein
LVSAGSRPNSIFLLLRLVFARAPLGFLTDVPCHIAIKFTSVILIKMHSISISSKSHGNSLLNIIPWSVKKSSSESSTPDVMVLMGMIY